MQSSARATAAPTSSALLTDPAKLVPGGTSPHARAGKRDTARERTTRRLAGHTSTRRTPTPSAALMEIKIRRHIGGGFAPRLGRLLQCRRMYCCQPCLEFARSSLAHAEEATNRVGSRPTSIAEQTPPAAAPPASPTELAGYSVRTEPSGPGSISTAAAARRQARPVQLRIQFP